MTADLSTLDSNVLSKFDATASAYGVGVEALAGVEWKPKEIPNLGLYAEIGYGITFLGDISFSVTPKGGSASNFTLTPNGYLGQTFWGVGTTWYF